MHASSQFWLYLRCYIASFLFTSACMHSMLYACIACYMHACIICALFFLSAVYYLISPTAKWLMMRLRTSWFIEKLALLSKGQHISRNRNRKPLAVLPVSLSVNVSKSSMLFIACFRSTFSLIKLMNFSSEKPSGIQKLLS